MTVRGEAYIAVPKMMQRMPTIMDRFSWVWAARSTESTTITMNTASIASRPSILNCTHGHGHGMC